jgi:hypothetical protein
MTQPTEPSNTELSFVFKVLGARGSNVMEMVASAAEDSQVEVDITLIDVSHRGATVMVQCTTARRDAGSRFIAALTEHRSIERVVL